MYSFQIIVIFLVINKLVKNEAKTDFSLIGMNTIQLVQKHNYPIETHYIKTEDGYILGVHRIPYNKTPNLDKKPAVLIIPGLTSSSADFINMGPGKSLGYILADQGMDVWISNNRGSTWSRNHTILSPDFDKQQFWNFSWHEIGYYDLPAIIDYILKLKGDDNLFYIGHSQGTTSFVVMAATRPEYNKKIKLAQLMGPSIFLRRVSNGMVRRFLMSLNKMRAFIEQEQLYELPFNSVFRQVCSEMCAEKDYQKVCAKIIFSVVGKTNDPHVLFNIFQSTSPIILSNTPAGASIKQFMHYAQGLKSKIFAYYDYGEDENLRKYGTEKPPGYNFSRVTAPIAFYHGKNDAFVNMKDLQDLNKELPNIVTNYIVPHDLFNHVDFIWAINASSLLYDKMLKDMQKFL